jgi:hypothetical protein
LVIYHGMRLLGWRTGKAADDDDDDEIEPEKEMFGDYPSATADGPDNNAGSG